MNMHTCLGFLRHLLTFGGGYLVANGRIAEPDLQEWVGIIITLVGAIWSAWDKYHHRPVATDLPPGSGTPPAAALLILVLLPAATLFLTGCGGLRRLTTAEIQIHHGTNSITVRQPKDTVMKRLSYNPGTGAVEVTGYSSAANAAAIAAQVAQTEAISQTVTAGIERAMQSMQSMVAAYLRQPAAAAAIPPASPAPAPATAVRGPLPSPEVAIPTP